MCNIGLVRDKKKLKVVFTWIKKVCRPWEKNVPPYANQKLSKTTKYILNGSRKKTTGKSVTLSHFW